MNYKRDKEQSNAGLDLRTTEELNGGTMGLSETQIKVEQSTGITMIEQYLANHAAFGEFLEERAA